MILIKEAYVTLETAKLLKQYGFRAKCTACYRQDLNNQFELVSGRIDFCAPRFNKCKSLPPLNAPTQLMAMAWIRARFNVDIFIEPGDKYSVRIPGYWLGIGYQKYEDACEAGIKYFLEKIIMKKLEENNNNGSEY